MPLPRRLLALARCPMFLFLFRLNANLLKNKLMVRRRLTLKYLEMLFMYFDCNTTMLR